MSIINQLTGRTTVTSSARLAQSLLRQYADYQHGNGLVVWQTPDVLPYEAWLQRCWQQAQDEGFATADRLLSDAEERLLWQRLIGEKAPGLLDIQQTAQSARQAWQLLQQWRISSRELDGPVSADVSAFQGWAQQYATLLRDNRWREQAGWSADLANPELLQQLMSFWAGNGGESAVAQFCFAGFDRFTPVQRALHQTLQQLGCDLLIPRWSDDDDGFEQQSGESTAIVCRTATDDQQELLAAAVWARQRLAEFPGQRLAIVIADLMQRRKQIDATFQRIFHPRQLVGAEAATSTDYAIAIGEPLAEYRLVSDALQLLNLLSWKIPLERLTDVLLSPFIGGPDSRDQRAELDLALRELNKLQLGPGEPQNLIGSGKYRGIRKVDLPTLAGRFEASHALLQTASGRKVPSGWTKLFVEQLQLWGWPGGQPLSSDLYQTLSAWQDLLAQFAGMDRIAGELDLAAALRLLKQLAGQRRFQPLNSDATVQLLSNIEPWPAQFDAIWVVGLDDRQFPSPQNSNPFLPLPLQRQFDMPGSSPAWSLRAARGEIAGWQVSGAELMISYSRGGEAGERSPTALLDWSNSELITLEKVSPAELIFAAGQATPGQQSSLEYYADAVGLALPEQVTAKGGAGLFQDQAECPFKAYVRKRLRTSEPNEPTPGLDAMQRGSLMHQALEYFWRDLGNSEALRALNDEQREQKVVKAVSAAVADGVKEYSALGSGVDQRLEQQRLQTLLQRWIVEELKREPFTVEGFEQQVEVTVAGLSVRGRIDRVDKLADGRQVVIDYKSGEVSRNQWFDRRLVAPQLPLYQRQFDQPAGIAVAQLKPGKLGFVEAGEGGLSPNKRKNSSDEPAWSELRQIWSDQLDGLAGEFLRGEAGVTPHKETVCRYCELQLVCRIGELANHQDDAGSNGP
ncbi:MAG: PD-(D/E)XK nuclease family protein [Immundisolibacteraceae bacterium]|nr:PD-(D/E)XK nuclease family protein [Immundisolibacteraceae bacterium]